MRAALVFFVLMATLGNAAEPAGASFKEIAARLPKETVLASSGKPARITVGPVDVRRTPSVLKPVVGTIDLKLATVIRDMDFEIDLRLEFSWKDEKWHFERLMNQRTRKDITNLPLGQDILAKGALREFLALHGL